MGMVNWTVDFGKTSRLRMMVVHLTLEILM
jgi:hypothetical protein